MQKEMQGPGFDTGIVKTIRRREAYIITEFVATFRNAIVLFIKIHRSIVGDRKLVFGPTAS